MFSLRIRCDGKRAGQNMYLQSPVSSIKDFNMTAVLDSWYSEKKDYDYATGSCSKVCGHYTQVCLHQWWCHSNETSYKTLSNHLICVKSSRCFLSNKLVDFWINVTSDLSKACVGSWEKCEWKYGCWKVKAKWQFNSAGSITHILGSTLWADTQQVQPNL